MDALPMLEEEARERLATSGPGIYGGKPLQEKIPEAIVGRARDQAADLFQTNPHYISDAKKLQREAPDLLEQVKVGDLTLTQAKRKLKERGREAIRQSNRELVVHTPPVEYQHDGQHFQTIVLDPPWDWGDEGDVDQFGRARPIYDTMNIEEIMALPVDTLVADNAHIYLWITNRSLPKGFVLLEKWGFRYVTCLTWCKPHFGMGNYFRGSTEHVLFGIKGSLGLLRQDVGTWFTAPRPGQHSAKPEEFHQLVESCSPGPWLEMFARSERNGWVTWGAEV